MDEQLSYRGDIAQYAWHFHDYLFEDGPWEQKVWIGTDSEENETIQLESVTSSTRRMRLQALPTITFSDCLFSKFRQRPRMGHLFESAQFKFTLPHEQGTHRGWSSRIFSSEGLVRETFRDWPDPWAIRVEGLSGLDYERQFIGSERLCAMKTNRIPNHGREHAMGKQDRHILEEMFLGPITTSIRYTACALDSF